MKTNEKGEYRYETIRPGQYKISAKQSRPAHIHAKAHCRRYKSLTTQLYFKDDDLNKSDPWFKASLAVEFKEVERKKVGKFDIVLPRA